MRVSNQTIHALLTRTAITLHYFDLGYDLSEAPDTAHHADVEKRAFERYEQDAVFHRRVKMLVNETVRTLEERDAYDQR